MAPDVTPPDWDRLQVLLDRVLDAPADQRADLLAQLAGGDPARRAALQELAALCERGLPLLDQPAAERFAALLEPEPARFPPALAERYRPARELGHGGMAAVFLARDLKHGRDVAVKLMRPELSAAVGRERFLREVAIAAQLRHPGIVPLFDSGDAGGVLYYVMPYEEGRSLRDRLASGEPVPLPEALVILRDLGDALAYAHASGIVHRDIKPENILLAGRRAMITDFGVARALDAAALGAPLTTAGLVMGTPEYMAPEQAAGGSADQRADIYALGVVGFELLAGERPFAGDPRAGGTSPAGSLGERLRRARPDAPEPLAQLLGRCLATRPDDRPREVTDLLAVLDRLSVPARGRPRPAVPRPWRAAAGIGAIALAAVAVLWLGRPPAVPLRLPAPRIAVLVFDHGSQPRLEPLAFGLTDNLIGALAEVRGWEVRSLRAVMPYRDSLPSIADLGRDLDVGWLVSGRLYAVGSQTTASVELADAETGRLVARTEASAPPGNDLQLIETIVHRVAAMLRERVGEEIQTREWRAGTASDAAFAAVNRARQERREASRLVALGDVPGALLRLQRADVLLDSAARADARWAEPWIQRANVALSSASMLSGTGQPPESVAAALRRGASHAHVARRLAPDAARTREVLGVALYRSARANPAADSAPVWLATAERVLREATQADTMLVDALTVLSSLHFARGEYRQAYVTAEAAFRADAYHGDPQEVLSRLFTYSFEAGEDGEARRWCAVYGGRFSDWYAGFCRLVLMIWDPAETPHPDTALRIAREATRAAESVIRSAVGAQLDLLAAGVLARTGDPAAARRIVRRVRAALASDSAVGRGPHGTELLEIEASVWARLGELDSAAVRLRELFPRQPDRALRLSLSRRSRELPRERFPTDR